MYPVLKMDFNLTFWLLIFQKVCCVIFFSHFNILQANFYMSQLINA